MEPTKNLTRLGLLDWSTIALGLGKNWIQKGEVVEYATSLLMSGTEDENIALIACGGSLSNDELLELVESQAYQVDIDRWRLAHLLALAQSNDSDQKKISKLQSVYAEFNYPEDMKSCSIYSQDNEDPIVVMMSVIDGLKKRLGC